MKLVKRFLLFTSIGFMFAGILLIIFSISHMHTREEETKKALTEARKKVSDEELSTTWQNVTQSPNTLFKKGDVIGVLEIPRLEAELPIIEGTNEDELEKGVGHYTTTVFPGQADQILLSGHRDTVFRRLGELEIGDTFHIIMPYGTFSYQIAQSQIVEANDTSIIQSTAPVETLTVSTCYPFSFIGNAPYRYVLTAYRDNTSETK